MPPKKYPVVIYKARIGWFEIFLSYKFRVVGVRFYALSINVLGDPSLSLFVEIFPAFDFGCDHGYNFEPFLVIISWKVSSIGFVGKLIACCDWLILNESDLSQSPAYSSCNSHPLRKTLNI